jgi:hypothetical protein
LDSYPPLFKEPLLQISMHLVDKDVPMRKFGRMEEREEVFDTLVVGK